MIDLYTAATPNGYKVSITLEELGLPYELHAIDLSTGAQKEPWFTAINPNGRIPLLEVPGEGHLSESHAIIAYLAEGSALVPAERLDRGRMWQWLCFEQYNLEPNIGTARFWIASLKKSEAELGEKLVEKRRNGHAALKVLEQGLADREFLVGNRYSLADIGLYAYTHVAPEGGFPLDEYPAIRAWCRRVAAQPGHVPITSS